MFSMWATSFPTSNWSSSRRNTCATTAWSASRGAERAMALQPFLAPSKAAATVPEYCRSPARFKPRLGPETTRSTGSCVKAISPSWVQSAGVPEQL